MPIFSNHSKEKELANLELALEQENQKEKWYNRTKEIMILYEEYQYKLKQYSNFQHSLFLLDEKLRQEKVLLESNRGAHSPMKALGQLANIQATRYELLDLKEQLYLLLLKIQLQYSGDNFSQFLFPMDFEEGKRKLVAERYLLLETNKELERQADFVINYLKKNEIKGVLMGTQNQSDLWIKALNYAGIEVFIKSHKNQKHAAKTQTLGEFWHDESVDQYRVSHASQIDPKSIELKKIPKSIFESRNELERWLEIEFQNSSGAFLFTDLEELIKLDKKFLGMD